MVVKPKLYQNPGSRIEHIFSIYCETEMTQKPIVLRLQALLKTPRNDPVEI